MWPFSVSAAAAAPPRCYCRFVCTVTLSIQLKPEPSWHKADRGERQREREMVNLRCELVECTTGPRRWCRRFFARFFVVVVVAGCFPCTALDWTGLRAVQTEDNNDDDGALCR